MNFNSGKEMCRSLILIIRGKKAKPRSTFLKSHPWWCRVRLEHLIHHIYTCAMFIALIILLPVAYWIQLRRMKIKTKRPNWNASGRERERRGAGENEEEKIQQQQEPFKAFPYFEYIHFASNMSLLLNLRDFTLLIYFFCFRCLPLSPLVHAVCVFLPCDRLLRAFNAYMKMEYTFFLSRPPFYTTIDQQFDKLQLSTITTTRVKN